MIHGTAVFFPHACLPLGNAFWVFYSLAFALPYWLYKPICSRFPEHPAIVGFGIAIPIHAGLYLSSDILLRTLETVHIELTDPEFGKASMRLAKLVWELVPIDKGAMA
ncbi:hypothetical protein [Candidatus Igneacidithiobacillus taiwanensis]|uniref:hypothetical protein n=1 Tax=Candidatus Igneacidithiobacillus taiwanensis TaxID=1945924 RepID=UPI00289C9B29|nr:hypothetical protein [Candidatus Igneacidithiobacillus taiwanensis]